MGQGENSTYQKNNLWLAVLTTLVLGLAIYLLVNPIMFSPKPPFLVSETPTLTPTNSTIATTTIITPLSTVSIVSLTPPSVEDLSTPTPIHYPTPFRGELRINLPEDFKVVQWRDDYIKCDKNLDHRTVQINGLIISGGTAPYEFRFWRFDLVSSPLAVTPIPDLILPIFITDNPIHEVILFDKVVELNKGVYVNVTIAFNWKKGKAVWIDDLYYPDWNDDQCIDQ